MTLSVKSYWILLICRWTRLLSVPSLIALGACVTSGHSARERQNNEDAQPVVVQQIGSQDPAVSPFGRAAWVDVRSKSKDRIRQAYAAMATGEVEAAEESMRDYLSDFPGSAPGTAALGTALSLSGQHRLAVFYATRLEKLEPGSPTAKNIRGLALVVEGQRRPEALAQARHLFASAFNDSSSQIAPGLNLGYLQMEMGQPDLAEGTFAQARSRCRDCSPAMMGHAVALSRIKQYQQSQEILEKEVSLRPRNSLAKLHLAILYHVKLKNPGRARSLLRDILAHREGDRDQSIARSAEMLITQLSAK